MNIFGPSIEVPGADLLAPHEGQTADLYYVDGSAIEVTINEVRDGYIDVNHGGFDYLIPWHAVKRLRIRD